MNKKRILNLGIILIAIILIVFLTIFILNNRTIIDIEMQSGSEQKTNYKLVIKKKGDYKLKVSTKLTEDSDEVTNITYNDKLTDLELEKINTIISYIQKKNDLNTKSKFKYNKDLLTHYDEETSGIIENMLIAIENISMGDIKINEISRREFGNTMLDNIISTQL